MEKVILISLKSFYRYMHSRTKSKDKVGPLKDSAGNVIDDDKGMLLLLTSSNASRCNVSTLQ